MGKALFAVAAAFVVLMFLAGSAPGPAPGPDFPPVPSDAPDFRSVFVSAINEGRVDRRSAVAHAEALAGICHITGDILEWDGTQVPPLVDTARKALGMRIAVRHFREEGGSFAEVYPSLGQGIEDYLNEKVGKDEKKDKDENTMTDALRRSYVDAYRGGLSPAFLRAAREL